MSRGATRLFSVFFNVAVLTLIFVVASQRDALAYLDPGTGSVIFQAAAAALLTSLLAVKVFWHRLTTFVSVSVLKRERGKGNGDFD